MATRDATSPGYARLSLRLASLQGDHGQVRSLLANHPTLVGEEPWAQGYMHAVEMPTPETFAEWLTLLDTALTSANWSPWRAAYAALLPNWQPLAWQSALGFIAEAVYAQEKPLDEALLWLQETAATLAPSLRARFTPILTGLSVMAAIAHKQWDVAARRQEGLTPASRETAHQRLLLGLYKDGPHTPVALWRAWVQAVVADARQHPKPTDIPDLVGGLDVLSRHHIETDQPAQLALPVVRLALELAPNDPLLMAIAASTLVGAGQSNEALRLIAHWKELAPTDIGPLMWEFDARLYAFGAKDALDQIAPLLGTARVGVQTELFDVVTDTFSGWIAQTVTERSVPSHLFKVWSQVLERVPANPARLDLTATVLLAANIHGFYNQPDALLSALHFLEQQIDAVGLAPRAPNTPETHFKKALAVLLPLFSVRFMRNVDKWPASSSKTVAARLNEVLLKHGAHVPDLPELLADIEFSAKGL